MTRLLGRLIRRPGGITLRAICVAVFEEALAFACIDEALLGCEAAPLLLFSVIEGVRLACPSLILSILLATGVGVGVAVGGGGVTCRFVATAGVGVGVALGIFLGAGVGVAVATVELGVTPLSARAVCSSLS